VEVVAAAAVVAAAVVSHADPLNSTVAIDVQVALDSLDRRTPAVDTMGALAVDTPPGVADTNDVVMVHFDVTLVVVLVDAPHDDANAVGIHVPVAVAPPRAVDE